MYRYYENVLKYRDKYSEGTHYLRMLALAFDRPAIRTTFHLENRATDFVDAISALQQAVATGVLKDRDGHVVDHVRIPTKQSVQINFIKDDLQKIRIKATEALKTGIIIEHGTTMEILDHTLRDELNSLKLGIVTNLNILLKAEKIDAIDLKGY